jgi:hypothetical protein
VTRDLGLPADARAAAIERVFAYLTDRQKWERSAAKNFGADPDIDRLAEVIGDYREAIAPHLAEPDQLDHVAFGFPASVVPHETRVIKVGRRRDALVVTTVEPEVVGTSLNEYILIKRGGAWLLADRRTRFESGGWIAGTL